MITSKLTNTGFVALTAFFCCLLWGSAFAGVKTGYAEMGITANDWASQMVFAGVRFLIAGLMALAAGSVTEKKLLIPERKSIPRIGVISLFQTILQYFFYYIGLAHTTGVKAAIIVAANVFAAILISSAFGQEKLTVRKIVGCILGFSGIVLVNLTGLDFHLNVLGDGFILLCTIASGFSSVFMKKYTGKECHENPVLLSGWQFAFGGAVMWLIGAVARGHMHLTGRAWMILLYLAFVSAAAYSLWAVLLKYNPVSKVAVFGFLNPLCGVMISSMVLHETGIFNLQGMTALLLVCSGIFTVNFEKKVRETA